ncbi:hypothetical protein Tco_1148914 [Tanacetum coccineum]
MSRANHQATIVSEEQLVPRANRLVIKKNNQRVASDSDITDSMLRFIVEILKHHKLYNLVSLTATVPIIYLHHIPRSSNSELHNAQDDQPITKLSNTVKGDYKLGMEIPDTMINDEIKKSAGYNYYIAKKKKKCKR